MAPNFPRSPADLFALCVDATWKCTTDLRLDCMEPVAGAALTSEITDLRGRRLDDLAGKAIYASQRDALLECIEARQAVRDKTLSLLGATGAARHYMLNAAPQLDAEGNFRAYIGSLRAWNEVPFSEHRQGEVVELLRRADAALDKESRLRREADILLAALQILIEPTVLQEKCAKLFEIFSPALAFDQALVLRRGFRAKLTVAASSDPVLLGDEWPEDAAPRAVFAGEARLVEGEDIVSVRQSFPGPLRASKIALFVPLRIGSETAVLVVLGKNDNQFKKQHLSLMQRVTLIATKAFQEEDQKAAVAASSKLAAMGELLTTIAHEINQPITIITMSAANGRMLIEDGGNLQEIGAKLERIELQARRAGEIIRAVRQLSYVGRLSTGHETIDLREALQAVETIAGIGLEKKDIALTMTVSASCPPAQGQSAWLQQVVLNLITNARDAIVDRLGESAGEAPGAIQVEAYPAGEHVVLRVADNGGGVPEDIQDKIFDPFFTLKEMGKGNGLGLALCQRLIAEMGGQITLHNDDKGAVFEIHLRPAESDASGASTAAVPRSATG